MEDKNIIFTEEQLEGVQYIRELGETREIYKMINLLANEFVKQSNSKELHLHWESDEGWLKNESKFF